uniref:Uncharacterized protein n=1 Tax=Rhizophora mucronata TaxID=61149 RepID=A0A2P2QXN0_RHIMU
MFLSDFWFLESCAHIHFSILLNLRVYMPSSCFSAKALGGNYYTIPFCNLH